MRQFAFSPFCNFASIYFLKQGVVVGYQGWKEFEEDDKEILDHNTKRRRSEEICLAATILVLLQPFCL